MTLEFTISNSILDI